MKCQITPEKTELVEEGVGKITTDVEAAEESQDSCDWTAK